MDHPFKPPAPKDGKVRNSCDHRGCGKAQEAHKPPAVKIHFQGKLWIFSSWAEARAKGFYCGD